MDGNLNPLLHTHTQMSEWNKDIMVGLGGVLAFKVLHPTTTTITTNERRYNDNKRKYHLDSLFFVVRFGV